MNNGAANGHALTENARFAPDATQLFNTRTDHWQLVILDGAYPRQTFSIEPGESGAEKCFCGGWSS